MHNTGFLDAKHSANSRKLPPFPHFIVAIYLDLLKDCNGFPKNDSACKALRPHILALVWAQRSFVAFEPRELYIVVAFGRTHTPSYVNCRLRHEFSVIDWMSKVW